MNITKLVLLLLFGLLAAPVLAAPAHTGKHHPNNMSYEGHRKPMRTHVSKPRVKHVNGSTYGQGYESRKGGEYKPNVDKYSRAEHVERPDRPERPERPERPNFERMDRGGRP